MVIKATSSVDGASPSEIEKKLGPTSARIDNSLYPKLANVDPMPLNHLAINH
jgi:hypothetical protein